ncbi:hypothetical protein GGI22_004995, partial [Coemansia erecta]
MPLFTPVNPPPAPKDFGVDARDGRTPEALLLRVEEQIRHLVQEYKSALRMWADTRFIEAFNKFDDLCKHSLLAQPQEAHIERECSAYCNEYGGMSIEHLRMLVFMNAGRLYICSNGGPDLCVGLDELECADLTRPRALSALCDESVLRSALDYFMKALQFGTAGVSHYLTIGQCALLLAQHDMAISMFTQAFSLTQPKSLTSLADAQGDDWITFSKSAGPRQWWCVVAAIHAFLMRGEVELAESISRHALAVYPEHNCVLSLHNEHGDDAVDSRVPAPPVRRLFLLPSVYVLSESKAPQTFVVETRSSQNTVSLERLGYDLLAFYDHNIAGAAGSNSDMAFTHVEYRIDQARRCDFLSQKAQLQIPDGPYVVQDSNIACDEPVSIATKDAGNSAADSLDVGEQTSNITPNNAASSNNMIDDDDNLAASADDSSNNDSA